MCSTGLSTAFIESIHIQKRSCFWWSILISQPDGSACKMSAGSPELCLFVYSNHRQGNAQGETPKTGYMAVLQAARVHLPSLLSDDDSMANIYMVVHGDYIVSMKVSKPFAAEVD